MPHADRKAYYRANAEKIKAGVNRARLARWGWAPGVFDEVCEQQRGFCAICGLKKKLVADHCHHTGKRRAAICQGCNARVGFYEASPLRAKVEGYVAEWKKINGR